MEVRLEFSELTDLIDYSSRSLCGKLLKRFEIIHDQDILKKTTKELIYEEYRHLRDLILSTSKGLGLSKFKFNRKENSK